MAETLLWVESGGHMTPARVVADFAEHNWPDPREATPIRDGQFQIVGGVNTYAVRTDGQTGTIRIYRLED
jgi:hypothetical protein